MKKKIALLSALALISLASCSNSSASSKGSEKSDDTSVSEDSSNPSEEESTSEDSSGESSTNSDGSTKDPDKFNTYESSTNSDGSTKDPDKFNTYSMEELYGENSPLIGYWHTTNKDMYIEYNEFGSEGFTIFVLGENLQMFSSQIGTFSGTPQNTEYILASSEDDADVANLYNRTTKFNMAVNDDNSISVFLDFGYNKTSTYTFEKMKQPADAIAPYCGTWGNSDGPEIALKYNESTSLAEFSCIFGFSTDQYPIGIPSISDDNECWFCCPYKNGMLTTYSNQGVFFDVINIHMEFNSDGSVNLNRSYTSPILINSGISFAGTVVTKQE